MRLSGDGGAGGRGVGDPPPPERVRGSAANRWVPWVAVAAVVLFFAGVLWPPLLGLAVVITCTAVSSLVLFRRSKPTLVRACVAIALWLAVGLSGAWWLQFAPAGGLVSIVLALFLLPLPLIPWLYARTFEEPDADAAGGVGSSAAASGGPAADDARHATRVGDE